MFARTWDAQDVDRNYQNKPGPVLHVDKQIQDKISNA